MRGGDGLRRGGHAHGVRAQNARGAHLGGRFELRAGEVHVNAFLQRKLLLARDLFGKGTQARGVDIGHIREARAEFLDVRPPERAKVEELDVVGDEHEVARLIVCVHSARGVRHDHRLRAKQANDANGVGSVLHGVALVAVHSALHDRDALAAKRSEDEAALVSRRGGGVEVRNVGIAHKDGIFDLIAEKAEAAAEHEQHLGAKRTEVRGDHVRALAVIVVGEVRLDKICRQVMGA